jgi:hypothetical protein
VQAGWCGAANLTPTAGAVQHAGGLTAQQRSRASLQGGGRATTGAAETS